MAVDHENDLVLVTCASGKQGSHLLPLLANKWKRLRLVVNSPTSEARLRKEYPDAEVLRADLSLPTDTDRILAGVRVVYHVGPSFHPFETEIGYNMIESAVGAGTVAHFVYSSVLNSQIRKMMNHDCKRYVEERLIESGLPYTILQPTHFMEMIPVAVLASQESPVHTANWDPAVAFSFIALRDLGEAGARVIEEREKHFLAQYSLTSTGPISYNEVCAIVGKALGKSVTVKQRSFEEAVEALLSLLFRGGPVHPYTRDTTERMLLYYNHHPLAGNPNVLEWLLGRKPTAIPEWAEMQVQAAKKK